MRNEHLDQFSADCHQSTEISEVERFELDLLLETIYRLTEQDFRNYSRSHLLRRLKLRMAKERLPTLTMLLNKLIHEPQCIPDILNDFSIQVTEMFRDPSFFRAFRTEVLPKLREHSSIYIWHAGCATGEEAVSMAILLYEEGLLSKSKIYATDLSQRAIDTAKRGIIPLHSMKAYTRNYLLGGGQRNLSDYYETDEHFASILPDLLETISFEKHNLALDGSFQAFHVILCRNVLIYFNNDLQRRAHQLFLDSLRPEGFLCLGHKESLFVDASQPFYEAINYKEAIYRKK